MTLEEVMNMQKNDARFDPPNMVTALLFHGPSMPKYICSG
jgi:hypothetical protein